jgi:hypothetical protein
VAATVQLILMKETILLIQMKIMIDRILKMAQVARILHLNFPHILEETMIALNCNIFKTSQLRVMKSAKNVVVVARRKSMIGKFLSLKIQKTFYVNKNYT